MMQPPPNRSVIDQYRVPPPKNLREVPGYLKTLLSAFFKRMGYIIKIVWEASPAIVFVMSFMALFDGVMPVIGTYITGQLINKLSSAYTGEITNFHIITWLLVAQFAYLLFNSIIRRIDGIVVRISGELVSNHIKIKIMEKAKEIDLKSFDSPDFYAKMENANREAGNRPIQVLNSTFSVISTVISLMSYLFLISIIGILPALLVIVVAIPSTIINFVYRKKNHDYVFRRSKDRRQMSYYSEVLVNKDLVKEVRMLGLADDFTERYKSVFKKYFGGLKKLMLAEMWWGIGATLLTTIVNCILFVSIARGVFRAEYPVGDYSMYTGALNAISGGIATLITTSASIYEGTIFINNLIAFMEEKKTIVPTLDTPLEVKRGVGHTIQFENVSFRYPGVDHDIIKNINLTINPGDTVVMVGLNGAGKTTLIKLLTRLYDPTDGRILLDGHDLREYDVQKLYDMFGIVFQDYGKYAVSVRDNIAFGEVGKKIRDEKILEAASNSNAAEFIDKLPDKYDTPLMRYFEENGIELSGGQWQKLAIARAFYSESDILILDEPTASLDPMAEQEIFNQFDALRGDKTSIFVSHRLSSATTADKIIVLKDGRLIEEGTHAELMRAQGEYYTLFSTQAKRYITPIDDNEEKEPPAKRGGKPIFKGEDDYEDPFSG
ncbi:MAG: ABC transporter ATP-binding protein [Clostridia bacterium]|nr:ABC transporter ATP-binding protein [Clostridia bacterium]